LFHADGCTDGRQTDRNMTKIIVAFRNIANALKEYRLRETDIDCLVSRGLKLCATHRPVTSVCGRYVIEEINSIIMQIPK